MKRLVLAEACYFLAMVMAVGGLALSFSILLFPAGAVMLALGGTFFGLGGLLHLIRWFAGPRAATPMGVEGAGEGRGALSSPAGAESRPEVQA